MNSEELQALQAPLKAAYAETPHKADIRLHAAGTIHVDSLTCDVETPDAAAGHTVSGLHPAAGGDGRAACSGDMLLQALVACSGVTFAAVSTAMGMQISSARVTALGTMDFRGTLGVDRAVPVGLTAVELSFAVETAEPDDKVDKLIQLTERYCVVLQTLRAGVAVSSHRGGR